MPSALVAIRDLTWRPPGEPVLFEGVDLEVAGGERVALVGPSGSGKSTLLRCVAMLEPRRSGEVYWRGDRVEPDDVQQFRRRVSYLHQEPADVGGTVGENLAFAREMAADDPDVDGLSRERQRELLEELGLGGIGPDREFQGLSVGERQRLALVRTWTLQPDVLLLDEPTASLDAERVDRVEKMVENYVDATGKRACVWVTHDRQQADRVASRHVDVRNLKTEN